MFGQVAAIAKVLSIPISAAVVVILATVASKKPDAGAEHDCVYSVSNFVWKSDFSEGISVRFPVQRDRTCNSTSFTAELGDALANDWEIREAKLFLVDQAGRHPTQYEGPYRQDRKESTAATWHLYSMSSVPYDIEVMLHRKTERMSFTETRTAILTNKGVRGRCDAIQSH